jgi:hypothetical protein
MRKEKRRGDEKSGLKPQNTQAREEKFERCRILNRTLCDQGTDVTKEGARGNA